MIATLRVAIVVVTLAIGVVLFAQVSHAGSFVFFLAYGGIGGYLAIRRPTNPIGWLLLLIGWGIEMGSIAVVVPDAGVLMATDLLTAFAMWGSGAGFAVGFLGVFCLSLVFPEGRLPSGTAGRFARLGIGVMLVLVAAVAFNPQVNVFPVEGTSDSFAPNPIAILPDATFWTDVPTTDALHFLIVGLVLVGLGSMLVRARRATGLVRLQFRWLIGALGLVVVATFLWAIATLGLAMHWFGLAFVPVLIAYPAVPAAIAVAVLRYRLYEIDRVISRSLSWAIVTALLVAVFAALVVGLQAALAGVTQGQTLAVAASTLIAFALFQPVRRRVQRAVDRRFDRARYDSEQTAAAFAERLRHQVDLDAVARDLTGSVERTLRPTTLGLWLKEPGR